MGMEKELSICHCINAKSNSRDYRYREPVFLGSPSRFPYPAPEAAEAAARPRGAAPTESRLLAGVRVVLPNGQLGSPSEYKSHLSILLKQSDDVQVTNQKSANFSRFFFESAG